MRNIFILFSLIVLNQAYAGNEVGAVRFEHGQYNSNSTSAGYSFFYLDGGVKNNNPACSAFNGGERWVINNNWPASKNQMSVLLTALTSGKNVSVRGSNDCSVWGDTETAIDIIIVN